MRYGEMRTRIQIGAHWVTLGEIEAKLLLSLICRYMDKHGRRPPVELIERWLGVWNSEIDAQKSGIEKQI